MVKFLIGLVTGVALVFLTIFLLFFALLRFRDKPPTVADNSVLVLRLQGDLPEKAPVELPAFLSDGPPAVTMSGIWSALNNAASDDHIRAVVVQPEDISAGWAKLQEVRM